MNNIKFEKTIHPFNPIFDKNSKILILGSMPSKESQKNGFYYGNSKNHFWKIISIICRAKEPQSIEEKISLLKKQNIALWDIIKSCDIIGSKDETIANVEVNKIEEILKKTKIQKIFTNGRKASEIYKKFVFEKTKINDIYLPSTSPANASFNIERLKKAWQIIFSDS